MKNTAKYAWSFSRNSSFLRGLFYYAAPCIRRSASERKYPKRNVSLTRVTESTAPRHARGRCPTTRRRSFPREAFPRDDAQGYVFARESQRAAETYPCASSRGNASRGKDRRVIGPHSMQGTTQTWNAMKKYRRYQFVAVCAADTDVISGACLARPSQLGPLAGATRKPAGPNQWLKLPGQVGRTPAPHYA